MGFKGKIKRMRSSVGMLGGAGSSGSQDKGSTLLSERGVRKDRRDIGEYGAGEKDGKEQKTLPCLGWFLR